MFNSGETVEEIGTGRTGVAAGSGIVGQPLNKWTVQFRDGRSPLIRDFTDPAELRSLDSAGISELPRLIPRDPFVI